MIRTLTAGLLLLASCGHSLMECRLRVVEVAHTICARACSEPPPPMGTASGVALNFSDPSGESDRCVCHQTAPADESVAPGFTPIHACAPVGACSTGCTETHATCLAACADLGSLPAYCERTCGAIYSRCRKRCARAAREQ